MERRLHLANVTISSTRAPSTPLQLAEDNRWRRTYEQVVREPGRFGIEGSGVVPPVLQLAMDETPVQYAAKISKTLVPPRPDGQGQGGMERSWELARGCETPMC